MWTVNEKCKDFTETEGVLQTENRDEAEHADVRPSLLLFPELPVLLVYSALCGVPGLIFRIHNFVYEFI